MGLSPWAAPAQIGVWWNIIQTVSISTVERHMTKRRKLALWLGIPTCLLLGIVGTCVYDDWRANRPEAILRKGRLGPLPSSARNVRSSGWGFGFAGEQYLRFSASTEDISLWLSRSPSIRSATPKVFSRDRMYLPHEEWRKALESHYVRAEPPADGFRHEYWMASTFPSWFAPTIRVKGRRFEIPGDPAFGGRHYFGWVTVDDAEGVVYVRVIWG